MYYLVYLITNEINNKIYIGVHKTWDKNDSYMGSGKALIAAQKKYGINNFKKQILHFCLTEDDMFEWERLIVDSQFCDREDTYNIRIGGKIGDQFYNTKREEEKLSRKKLKEEWQSKYSHKNKEKPMTVHLTKVVDLPNIKFRKDKIKMNIAEKLKITIKKFQLEMDNYY